MKKTLAQLKDERVAWGEKVSDLSNQVQMAMLDNTVSVDDTKKLQASLDDAKKQRNSLAKEIESVENKAAENLQKQYGEGSNFVNQKGQSVKILNKNDKLSSEFANDTSNADLGKLVKGMITGRWENAIEEQKLMAMNTTGDGNVLIPTPLSTQMIDMVRANSVLNQAGAFTVPMDSSSLTVAKQTGDIATNWKKEGDSIVISDPTFTPVVFNAKTLVGMCKVTIEMLEDAQNIGQLISDSLVQSLALSLDRAGIVGTGTDPEPLGLYNRTAITKQPIGKALENYKDISNSLTTILGANGQANAIIMNPRTYGELDNLTDTLGQPLNAPQSYVNLEQKLTTTQIPTNLGADKDESFAIVGDFSKLWMGLRTNVVLEVSRTSGDVFDTMEYAVRAYLRADYQTVHDPHFVVLDGIK